MSKITTELFVELLEALEGAREHLEYTGYGDSWERECAYHDDLPGRIEIAITKAREVTL